MIKRQMPAGCSGEEYGLPFPDGAPLTLRVLAVYQLLDEVLAVDLAGDGLLQDGLANPGWVHWRMLHRHPCPGISSNACG